VPGNPYHRPVRSRRLHIDGLRHEVQRHVVRDPHVAALAGLLISINPALTNSNVRQIISETTDKINASGYVYLPTPGKPYGTWTNEVGYGRIIVT
jgi:subtilisin family serine protease